MQHELTIETPFGRDRLHSVGNKSDEFTEGDLTATLPAQHQRLVNINNANASNYLQTLKVTNNPNITMSNHGNNNGFKISQMD